MNLLIFTRSPLVAHFKIYNYIMQFIFTYYNEKSIYTANRFKLLIKYLHVEFNLTLSYSSLEANKY